MSKNSKARKKDKEHKKPKQKCCVSQPRCKRCPLRMLAEGTLPAGYSVRHRKLVALDEHDTDKSAKKAKKKARKRKRNKKYSDVNAASAASDDTARRAA